MVSCATPLSISRDLEGAVLALNNAHSVELSWLEDEPLRVLLSQAFYARRIGSLDAFLIAFEELASYDSPNYLWFRARYPTPISLTGPTTPVMSSSRAR